MLGKFSDKFSNNFPSKNVQVQNLKEFRPKLFEEFQNTLQEKGAIVLHGAPGVGKTEFAKQYAYETKENYKYIGWINAKTESNIIKDLQQMATQINIENPSDEIEVLARTVTNKLKEEIGRGGKALIIFNDAENEEYLEKNILLSFKDRDGICNIIITSQSRNWNPEKVNSIRMEPLTEEEAIKLINGLTNDKNDYTKNEALDLAKTLGMLPLTIVPAVQYIQLYSTFKDYIINFQTRERSSNGVKGSPEHVKELVHKMLKSLDNILKLSDLCDSLTVLSYLNHDNIPKSWIDEYLRGQIYIIHDLLARSLISKGVIDVGGEQHMTYSINKIYQDALRDQDFQLYLSVKENPYFSELFMVLGQQFKYKRDPQTEVELRPIDSIMVAHVEKVLEHTKAAGFDVDCEYAELINSLGIYLYNQNHFKESIGKFEEVKKFIESKIGPDVIAGMDIARYQNLTKEQKDLVSFYSEQILHNLGHVMLSDGIDHQPQEGTQEILKTAYNLQKIFAPNEDKTLHTLRNLGRAYSTRVPVNFERAEEIINNLSNSNAFESANMKFLLHLDKATIYREKAQAFFENKKYVESIEFWKKGIAVYEECEKLLKNEVYKLQKKDLMTSYSFNAKCNERIGDYYKEMGNSEGSIIYWGLALYLYYQARQLDREYEQENTIYYNKDDFQNFLNFDSSRDFAGLTKVHMKLSNYASAQYYLEIWQRIQQYLFSSQPNHPYLKESNKCKIEIEEKLSRATLTERQEELVRDNATNIEGKIKELTDKFEYSEILEALLLHEDIKKRKIETLESNKEKLKKREKAQENEAQFESEEEEVSFANFKASHELSKEGKKCLQYLKDEFIKKIIYYTNLVEKKGEDSDEGKSALQIIGDLLEGVDSSKIEALATASTNPIAAVAASANTAGQLVISVGQLIAYFQNKNSKEAQRMLDILNNKEMFSTKLGNLINGVSSTIVYNWSEQIDKLKPESLKIFSEQCIKNMLEYTKSGGSGSLPIQKKMLEGLNNVKPNIIKIKLATTSNQKWNFYEMLTGCGIKLYCVQSEESLPKYQLRYTRKDKNNDHSDKYGYRWGFKSEVEDLLYQKYENETEASKALEDYKNMSKSKSKHRIM